MTMGWVTSARVLIPSFPRKRESRGRAVIVPSAARAPKVFCAQGATASERSESAVRDGRTIVGPKYDARSTPLNASIPLRHSVTSSLSLRAFHIPSTSLTSRRFAPTARWAMTRPVISRLRSPFLTCEREPPASSASLDSLSPAFASCRSAARMEARRSPRKSARMRSPGCRAIIHDAGRIASSLNSIGCIHRPHLRERAEARRRASSRSFSLLQRASKSGLGDASEDRCLRTVSNSGGCVPC